MKRTSQVSVLLEETREMEITTTRETFEASKRVE